MFRVLVFSAVLLAPAAAHAQVYRWVDANGQAHYAQTRPKDQPDATLLSAPPPPAAAPNQDALGKSLADAQRAAAAKQGEPKTAADAMAQHDAQCLTVNNQLAAMASQTAQRLRVTDEAFQARKKELEDFLAVNCH